MIPNLTTQIGKSGRGGDPVSEVLKSTAGDRAAVQHFVTAARHNMEKRLKQQLAVDSHQEPPPAEIRGARLRPPLRSSSHAAVGIITARLPDGRAVRLSRAAARQSDVLSLQRVTENNTRHVYDAIVHNSSAINRLAARQRKMDERISDLESSADLALLRGLIEGLSRMDRRVKRIQQQQRRAVAAQTVGLKKQLLTQKRAFEMQTRTAQIQKLHTTAASIQTAAFGTSGSMGAKNNLLLALNQLGWSFLPQILETLGLAKPEAARVIEWLAPAGNLLTGQIVLGRHSNPDSTEVIYL